MVFLNVADPVGLGLVESLAHPGGNVTGFATVVPEGIIGKHLQILKELVPQATRVAVLINPTEKMHQLALQRLPDPARLLGLELVIVEASEPDQFATAFEKAHAQGAEAISIWNGPLVFRHSTEIADLAARYRLPAIYFARQYVLDGGLLSYAPDPADNWRRAAGYISKIFEGENPGNLPVQQPTRYDLIINLKAAKSLGVTVPPSILAQAGRGDRIAAAFVGNGRSFSARRPQPVPSNGRCGASLCENTGVQSARSKSFLIWSV